MSQSHTSDGPPRRRYNKNPRRPSGGQSGRSRSGNETFRRRPPKQTTFQKILSFLTFGLLGGPKKKPASRREPTRNVTVVSGQRSHSGENRRPRRESEPADLSAVTSGRLYIGNLSYDASESDLFELFNGVGAVKNAEVVVNSRTQRSKGFAFVTMDGVEEARRAVAELHGKDFMGRPLQLSGAKPSQRDHSGRGETPSEEADDDESEGKSAA